MAQPPSIPIKTRERAFLLALVVILGLAALAGLTKTEYISLGPGPVTDTLGSVPQYDKNGLLVRDANGRPQLLPLIQVTGLKTYPTSGKLQLTTVQVSDKLSLFEALLDWTRHDLTVVPRELEYPKDKTDKQVETENRNDMQESRADAVTVALEKLHLLHITVESTVKGAPADGVLKAGDEITAINAQPVFSALDIRTQLAKAQIGHKVGIRFVRGGEQHVVLLTTIASPSDKRQPAIGVQLSERTKSGQDVQIVGLNQVGGPSAGLMFALGIYDTLTPGALTGGKNIAGTGTIDSLGNVGAIGGITLKMIGAQRQGATWFLTPADNCDEARTAIPDGLRLAKVATFDDALAAVKGIAAGRTDVPSC